MFHKLFSAFIAGTLLVSTTTSVLFAQDAPPYCAILEQADCDLLTTSAEVMQDIQSMDTRTSATFNLTDIPDMPFDEVSVEYDQRSTFSIDPEAMGLVKEIQGMSQLEMVEMMSNPLDTIDFVETIVTGMDLSLEMEFEVDDPIRSLLNEEVRSEIGADLPPELGVELRFIDGIIYADLSAISAMIPELGMFIQGWVGIDSAPLIQMARDEMAAAGIDENFEAPPPAEFADNPFAAMPMGNAGPLITQVGDLDPTGEVYTYLSVERLSETDDAVSFVTTMDYDAFMKSAAFRELVYLIMTEDGSMVTAQELDEIITLAQIMAPAFLGDLFLELSEVIDPTTGYMTAGALTLNLDLKSILTLASQGDPSLRLEPDDEPSLSFSTLSTNISINEEVNIRVPDGAFVVPTEMLMMLLNS